ncbi:TPA: hypothetical protein HA225_05520 [Candidatus Micrarchaeota archaeon]|nr:hypothetical protein [Candidatus Micrarchaeota archaeon]HIH29865.1 hypothetical protein [Candidatus Micrarchaeota archaeon]
MEDEEKESAANSEIRFLTLELMKLAHKSGKSFEEVARKYLENGERLHSMLKQGEGALPQKKSGSVIRQK